MLRALPFIAVLAVGCAPRSAEPPAATPTDPYGTQTFKLAPDLYVREVTELLPDIDKAISEGESGGANMAGILFERFTRLGTRFEPLVPPPGFKTDHDGIGKALSLYATGYRLLDVGTTAANDEFLKISKTQLSEAKSLFTKSRAGWKARAAQAR